jgi:hypothetical protein
VGTPNESKETPKENGDFYKATNKDGFSEIYDGSVYDS